MISAAWVLSRFRLDLEQAELLRHAHASEMKPHGHWLRTLAACCAAARLHGAAKELPYGAAEQGAALAAGAAAELAGCLVMANEGHPSVAACQLCWGQKQACHGHVRAAAADKYIFCFAPSSSTGLHNCFPLKSCSQPGMSSGSGTGRSSVPEAVPCASGPSDAGCC